MIAAVLHWHLLQVYLIPASEQSWFTHRIPLVFQLTDVKILWDFGLSSDHVLPADHNHHANHPDIVVFDYWNHLIYYIEVFCLAVFNVSSKKDEKLRKY